MKEGKVLLSSEKILTIKVIKLKLYTVNIDVKRFAQESAIVDDCESKQGENNKGKTGKQQINLEKSNITYKL